MRMVKRVNKRSYCEKSLILILYKQLYLNIWSIISEDDLDSEL